EFFSKCDLRHTSRSISGAFLPSKGKSASSLICEARFGGRASILPKISGRRSGAAYAHFGRPGWIRATFYGVSPPVIALAVHSCCRFAKLDMDHCNGGCARLLPNDDLAGRRSGGAGYWWAALPHSLFTRLGVWRAGPARR